MSTYDTIFPIICEIINNHEGWINRDEIAQSLRKNPHTEKLIQQYREKGGKKTVDWKAGNMVDWFSQAYTDETEQPGKSKAAQKYNILDFERKKTGSVSNSNDGIWQYRSTKASKLAK